MGSSNSSFSAATYSSTYLKWFWELREVRKVLKVNLSSLLKKRVFSSSHFLSFPSPPSLTQISLHKAAFFMFPFVQETSRLDPRSVEMNEETRLQDLPLHHLDEHRQLQQPLRAETIAGNWQHTELMWNSAEKRPNLQGRLSLRNHSWTSSKQNFEVFLSSLEVYLTLSELD